MEISWCMCDARSGGPLTGGDDQVANLDGLHC